MKEFLKKYSVVLAIIAAIAFLAVFLPFIFHKVGDDVYVVDMYGSVNIGTADDLNNLKSAEIGMKLSKNNIVVTGDKSSCVLSYNKKATAKDNFVNVGENSQVMLYDRNQQGGYRFFITYGSVICNMPNDRSYRTNISTKLFNLFVDSTISKVTYDADESSGKVYTFDGNPKIQIIQPSGATSSAEKLLKNSVCAVTNMDDGTVGFGCLNVGFGLNSLTAQDLKTMSGVANTWAEKISYGSNEFEQAFQTASDYAKWAATEPAFVTTPPFSEIDIAESVSNDTNYAEGTTVPVDTEFTDNTFVPDESVVTSYTMPSAATQTVPDEFTDAVIGDSSNVIAKSSDFDMPVTAFSRETALELGSGSESNKPSVTTAPMTDETETVTAETRGPRETEPYNPSKPAETNPVTSNSQSNTAVTSNTTHNNSVTSTKPGHNNNSYSTGTKPSITTVTDVPVDKNATFTVIFTYVESGKEYWAVQLVKYGDSAVAPEIPNVVGRRFVRWDKNFSKVTSDMTITAVFTDSDEDITVFTAVTTVPKASNQAVSSSSFAKDVYTVSFYVDSKLWKSVTVNAGETAVVSEVPTSGNKKFCGWSESLTNIHSDKTVFALFVEN